MKFGPETKVRLECKKCGIREIITLGDLPTTQKKSFIIPINVQCIQCLDVVTYNVLDEDQE